MEIKYASRGKLLLFTRRDFDNFVDAMEKKIGPVKIVPFEYWKDPVDRRANQKPPHLRILYLDHVLDERAYLKRIWLEPPGWVPEWETEPTEDGIYFLKNPPKLQINYFLPGTVFIRGHEQLSESQIDIRFDPEDKEQRSFVGKVHRIIEKMAVNEMTVVDVKSDWRVTHRGKTMYWAGPDAVAWCLADPRRTLTENARPIEPDATDC